MRAVIVLASIFVAQFVVGPPAVAGPGNLKTCDCGAVWGDLDGDGYVNPQDVVVIVNYVYMNVDTRVQLPDCPVEAGDLNCDGQVRPPDAVILAKLIYEATDLRCADPCSPVGHDLADDPGSPDVLTIGYAAVHDVSVEQSVAVPIYVNWDEADIYSVSVPVWIKSAVVDLDTVVLTGGFAAGTPICGFTRDAADPNKGHVYAHATAAPNAFAGTGSDRLFATIQATVSAGASPQCVDIDTCFLAPGISLLMTNGSAEYWTPQFTMGQIDILQGCGVLFDCGTWGDVSGDGKLNPVDVAFMITLVYKEIDYTVQPPNCPRTAGDANCDDAINPLDVTCYVQRVYKNVDLFCSNPEE